MRLRSRPYLHYAPVDGGVYFGGTPSQFVLRGPELLFKVADICVPMLDTGTTEDELVAALGGERSRPVVARLVRALDEHGMLLDLDRLTVAAPPEGHRERYAESLAYLESFSDDPYAVFARIHSAHVLVCGPAQAVLPAARGLARAGVVRLTVASPEPEVLAGLADRLAVPAVPLSVEQLAPVVPTAQAVIWCVDEDRRTADTARLELATVSSGVPLVPAWFGGRVALVGPPVRDRRDLARLATLRRRSLRWAQDEALEPPTWPAAGALAGALAGQLAFDLLAGAGVAAEAHVVYGDELSVDRIVVGAWRQPDQGQRPAGAEMRLLDAAPPVVAPTPAAAADLVDALTGRWTGLLAGVTAPDLPQVPLAYAQVEHRADRTGRFLGWAGDRQAAMAYAVLAGLRDRCTGPGVPAAGLSEAHWLLDGALRLLADRAVPSGPAGIEELDARGRQVFQALADEHPAPLGLRLRRVPGLDWCLGEVGRLDSGAALGIGWGRDRAEAIGAAVAMALARVQVPATDQAPAATEPCCDALVFAGDADLAELRRQVGDLPGVAFVGRSEAPDDVLDDRAVWYGAVAQRPTTGAA